MRFRLLTISLLLCYQTLRTRAVTKVDASGLNFREASDSGGADKRSAASSSKNSLSPIYRVLLDAPHLPSNTTVTACCPLVAPPPGSSQADLGLLFDSYRASHMLSTEKIPHSARWVKMLWIILEVNSRLREGGGCQLSQWDGKIRKDPEGRGGRHS